MVIQAIAVTCIFFVTEWIISVLMLVYEYMNRFPIIIYASEAQTKTRFGYLDKICKRQFHKDYM